jgi:hypothetical protein
MVAWQSRVFSYATSFTPTFLLSSYSVKQHSLARCEGIIADITRQRNPFFGLPIKQGKGHKNICLIINSGDELTEHWKIVY